jgi:transcriptional regulator with XRE-family HTH domain
VRVVVAINVRRGRFGDFIRNAMADARSRNITIPQIEDRTGVSKTMLYRWRDGTWERDPNASLVRAFCEALDLPVEIAYATLGWSLDGKFREPLPTIDPDVVPVLRILNDPNVPATRKDQIRAALRLIAGR